MMRAAGAKAAAKAKAKAGAKAAPKAAPKAAAGSDARTVPQDFPPLPGLPPLPLEALTVGEEIGKGRFKNVNRGVLKSYVGNDGNEADRDIVVIRYSRGKPECIIELQVLSRLALLQEAADNVPRVYGAAEQGRDLILVQERAAFGSLKAVVQNAEGPWTPAHGLRTAKQIASGMHSLESARVAHADLSCRNILVQRLSQDPDSILVKVTDFGLSAIIEEGMDHKIRKQPQATRWVSPETVAHQKLSCRADVWSVGALLWEAFSGGNAPWVNWPKRTEVAARMREMAEAAPGSPEASFDAAPEFPAQDGYPAAAHAALLSCFQVDEYARPKFLDLLKKYEEAIRLEADQTLTEEIPKVAGACVAEVPSNPEVEAALMETSASPGAPSTSAPSAPLPTAPLPAVPLPTSPSASPSASLAPSPAHEAPPNLPRTEGAVPKSKSQRFSQVDIGSNEVLALIAQQKEMLEMLRSELHEMRSKSLPKERISCGGVPQRETLIPLSDDGVAIKPAHQMAMAGTFGTWTLRTLAGPGLMRKQEFQDKEDAWQAFIYCADTAQPCHLLDPSGQSRASSGWTGACQFQRVQQAVHHDPSFATYRVSAPFPTLRGGFGAATPPLPAWMPAEPRVRFLC
ncbi:unnamed protein product [Effrenium voratum]|nr:unnamed protein product [Effrenium voratum]|eukprot:CAMPEP_0181512174 /NCGR_PEP_ID=MMETSP1110-20121109/61830_1 /TAXON_ID=174948 /ORGANISM="Symbiodinium sp., Strain CCMP421" /LENGTH=627 /DNA_ID=CAMNT_0023641967 /DNA_START=41 /DNA_END=1924 /DNA_ORIENTATION=-